MNSRHLSSTGRKTVVCKHGIGAPRAGAIPPRRSRQGGLAQLARASALHAEGQRFESVILHLESIDMMHTRKKRKRNESKRETKSDRKRRPRSRKGSGSWQKKHKESEEGRMGDA